MNMNRKLLIISILVFSFFIFDIKVNAVEPECRLYSETDCDPLPVMDPSGNVTGGNSNCKWDYNQKICMGKSERIIDCNTIENNDGNVCEIQPGCVWKSGKCQDEKCDKNDEANCKGSKNCIWDVHNNKCIDYNSKYYEVYIDCNKLSENKCNETKACRWDSSSQICVQDIVCEKLTEKKECDIFRKCQWRNNECTERYVANKPCEEASIKKVLRLFGYLIQLLRLAIPLIIIILGTFDVYEAVVDKDEKLLGKKIKQLGIRIIGGVFIFFIPTILNAIFVLSDKLNIMSTSEYQACETCLLKPSKCVINESEEENNNNNNSNSNNSNNNSNNNTNKTKDEYCNQFNDAYTCAAHVLNDGCGWDNANNKCIYKS